MGKKRELFFKIICYNAIIENQANRLKANLSDFLFYSYTVHIKKVRLCNGIYFCADIGEFGEVGRGVILFVNNYKQYNA